MSNLFECRNEALLIFVLDVLRINAQISGNVRDKKIAENMTFCCPASYIYSYDMQKRAEVFSVLLASVHWSLKANWGEPSPMKRLFAPVPAAVEREIRRLRGGVA